MPWNVIVHIRTEHNSRKTRRAAYELGTGQKRNAFRVLLKKPEETIWNT
jgi:hypothetical protein